MISVVIPVYNQWALTKACLNALAKWSRGDVEVIVVDNASSDETQRACSLRGERLFGVRFAYCRNEVNRNFSGACNQGAEIAQGEYVLFLNNDTEVLGEWEAGLKQAFEQDSRLGGVTPLLVYPVDSFGVERVQHVGVTFSPERRVSHLYEFFPAEHELMKKVRRFQAVTAAALCVPRALFRSIGGFDEGFVNGFEDVELCRRMGRAGWEFTVASGVKVRHLCGQSAGRGEKERENAERLTQLCPDIVGDKAKLVRDDGYGFGISPWLSFEVEIGIDRKKELAGLLKNADARGLWAGVNQEPYWMEGWQALARVYEQGGQPVKALEVLHLATQFRATPETLLPLWRLGSKMGVLDCFEGLERALRKFVVSEGERISLLRDFRKRFRGVDAVLCADAQRLLGVEAVFFEGRVAPLARMLSEATAKE